MGRRGMEAPAAGEIFMFEAFRLPRRGLCRRDEHGGFVPVSIGTRVLDALRVLIAANGDLVSKDEIMDAVWPGTVVEDNNLTVQISALRRVLDQGRAGSSSIQTVSGRGYRFVPPVTRAEGLTAASISTPGNGSGGPVTAAARPEPPSAMYPIDTLPPRARPRAPHRLRRAAIAITAALCLAAVAVVVAN